jgi:ABC-type branched-subunit amino acid transport system substrate-binding protein
VSRLLAALLLVTLLGAAAAQPDTARPQTVSVAFFYPQQPARPELNTYTYAIAGESARKGAELAAEEFGWAAQQAGFDFRVLLSSAPTAASAGRAARRLIASEGIIALIGGFDSAQAQVLSELAAERDLLFLNTGSTDRSYGPGRNALHLMPDVDTWLATLLSVAEPEGETWFVLHAADTEGEYRLERARQVLAAAGTSVVQASAIDPAAPRYGEVLDALRENPEATVLLLLDWQLQLDFLGRLESSGLDVQVFSLPDSVSMTREFYGMLRTAAPHYARLQLTLCEATLATPEAQALNGRYLAHFGEPMDAPAWAAFEAVRLVYEATVATQGGSAAELLAFLAEAAELDVDKDAAVHFDPDSLELLQPLYAVRIMPYEAEASLLDKKLGRAQLELVISPSRLRP